MYTVCDKTRDKSRSRVCPYPCLYALIRPKWHKAAVTGGTGGDRLVPPNLFSGIVPSNCATHNELKSTNDTNWTGQRGMWDQL